MRDICKLYTQDLLQPANTGGSHAHPAPRRPIESRSLTLVTLVTFVFILVTSLNLMTEAEKERAHQTHPRPPPSPSPPPRDTTTNSNTRNTNTENTVCRDVFEISKTSTNMTEWMKNAVKIIADYKRRKKFIPSLYYELIGLDTPSMIGVVNDSSGHTGTNITVSEVWRFDKCGGHLPHLSCHLRKFDAPEVERCVRARRNRTGRSTWVTYLGDSRVRLHVELLIDLLRDLRPTITTYKGEVVPIEDFLGKKGLKDWIKYKHNFRVEVEGKDNSRLVISFLWSAILERSVKPLPSDTHSLHVGAKEFLHNLTKAPTEELPDLMIMNTGAWQLSGKAAATEMQILDLATLDVMNTLRPYLSHLAARTTVVWALPDPFKEYINHDTSGQGHFTRQTNSMLEWLSNAQTSLQPPGVIIWDSFLPIAHQAHSDCTGIYANGLNQMLLPTYSQFDVFFTWECMERMHTGLEALTIAVQMMLNQLCNPYMPGDHCCSR